MIVYLIDPAHHPTHHFSLTQLLFVPGPLLLLLQLLLRFIIKFTYGISAAAEAGSSDVKLDNEHT